MKRRDWKTKKLKKSTCDKFYKRRTIFFLRRLFLRKNLVLLRKNLTPQFIFYNNAIKTFYFKKHFNFNKIYNLTNLNYLSVLPSFYFQKNIFKNIFTFKNIAKSNNLDFFFNLKYFFNVGKGNNLIVFDEKNNNIIPDSKIKDILKIDSENKKDVLFTIKSSFFLKEPVLNKTMNFFINYNLYFFCNLEVYKIIVLLFLLKSK